MRLLGVDHGLKKYMDGTKRDFSLSFLLVGFAEEGITKREKVQITYPQCLKQVSHLQRLPN